MLTKKVCFLEKSWFGAWRGVIMCGYYVLWFGDRVLHAHFDTPSTNPVEIFRMTAVFRSFSLQNRVRIFVRFRPFLPFFEPF